MAMQHADNEDRGGETAGKALKRRGILAAAGAVVAGIVAKQVSQPVEAADGDIIHLGDGLTGTLHTVLNITNATAPPFGVWEVFNNGKADAIRGVSISGATASAGVRGESAVGSGVIGVFGPAVTIPTPSGRNGVYGYATVGTGVQGTAIADGGVGVAGNANGGPGALGVFGVSNTGTGVQGSSVSGVGVSGASNGNHGVSGTAGVAGTTFVTAGVFGNSGATYGVIGNSTAPGYSGLTGVTSTPGVAALAATATVTTAYAAYFQGNTVVQGNFAVVGGNKSAAVKDASGQHRLVYCVESPESWFEDFGRAKLVNGKAVVLLDKTFAEIVHTDDYYVFLTPEGDFHAHVAKKTVTDFTVQQTTGTGTGAANGVVSYRIVAKRKDIAGERLAKWEMPKINTPDPAKLPKPAPLNKP